jgi:hypothetical protein
VSGETKWKAGDTVWAARFGWRTPVECDSAIVKSVGKVQVVLPERLSAFGCVLRIDADKVYASPSEALAALIADEETNLVEARAALTRVEENLRAARAALARARGEQP